MKIVKKEAVFVGALFGVACVLIGVTVGQSTDVVNWLDRWSTMITGCLAALAAAATVFQMQATDMAQGLRHLDLMRLSLRPDELRLARIENAIKGYWADWPGSMDTFWVSRQRARSEYRERLASGQIMDIVLTSERIKNLVDISDARSARHLFDERADSAFLEFDSITRAAIEFGNNFVTEAEKYGIETNIETEHNYHQYSMFFDLEIPEISLRFLEEVRRLRSLYS